MDFPGIAMLLPVKNVFLLWYLSLNGRGVTDTKNFYPKLNTNPQTKSPTTCQRKDTPPPLRGGH